MFRRANVPPGTGLVSQQLVLLSAPQEVAAAPRQLGHGTQAPSAQVSAQGVRFHAAPSHVADTRPSHAFAPSAHVGSVPPPSVGAAEGWPLEAPPASGVAHSGPWQTERSADPESALHATSRITPETERVRGPTNGSV